jgi:hypothetical protein
MAESKSNWFSFWMNAHSEKSPEIALQRIKELARISEWRTLRTCDHAATPRFPPNGAKVQTAKGFQTPALRLKVAYVDRPLKKGGYLERWWGDMSFDVYLFCFERGKNATFPFSLVETAFGSHAVIREPDRWVVDYGEEGRGEMYVDASGGDISGFAVNRPPWSLDFWQGVLTLLQHTPSCLCWGSGLVIAQPWVREHLPRKLKASLGDPSIVSKPEEIRQSIVKS